MSHGNKDEDLHRREEGRVFNVDHGYVSEKIVMSHGNKQEDPLSYPSSFSVFLSPLPYLLQTYESMKPGLEKAGTAISGATHDVIDKASIYLRLLILLSHILN